jgi:hypothetical protein
MNGEEQRARHTAVERAEKRLDDLELIVVKMAEQAVEYRTTLNEDFAVYRERLRLYTAREIARLDEANTRLARQLDTFTNATRWQRIRWMLRF